jgi:uncharacterized protein (TIGR03437 family)
MVTAGGTTNALVALADVSGSLDPTTPTLAAAGQTVTVRINLVDPGGFLGGPSALYLSPSPPSQNLSYSKFVSSSGGGLIGATFRFDFDISSATAGMIYYQFGAYDFAFNLANGQETPYFFWPNLETGAQAPHVTFVSSSTVFVSVTNIPSSAQYLAAVVDGAGIPGPLTSSQTISPGIGSSSMSVAVPPGGPYRIRVIALATQFVLRSGKTTVSTSSSGTTSASVTLADVSGTVDPSTPAAGGAGTRVAVKLNLTDPGDFLDGPLYASGRLFSWTSPPSINLYLSAQTTGTLVSQGSGVYQFTCSVNLPTSGGKLYYQFAEVALPFTISGRVSFLAWPNLETGAQAQQIVVVGPLAISSLSPASTTAGVPAFTLLVSGTGFVPGSVVQWNGSTLPTTYTSGTQLSASVSASLVAAPGTAGVTVNNPGGAFSNTVSFPINTPIPYISGLVPNSVVAGGPGFTLIVNGSGFKVGATVRWNFSPLPTNFLNSSQLSASVPANLLAQQNTASVFVANPDGSASNSLSFTVTAPTPVVSGLSPSSTPAGGPSFTLTVNGSGFASASAVQWNGSALSTAYVSAVQLSAAVPASMIANPGNASVTVVNPGNVASNAASFAITIPTPSISALNPPSTTAGSPAFSLTVMGSGFVLGSSVVWTGLALSTSYINSAQLTALIPANLISTPGTGAITVVNPGGFASNSVTFTVQPGLGIVTASPLPAGTVGITYSQTLTATGGAPPYQSWVLSAGSLPPGIALTTLNGAGLLNGTPTVQGNYAFTVQVTDNAKAIATKQLSLTINAPAVLIAPMGIVNSAGYAGDSVAPGEIVTIFGSGLGPTTLANAQLDSQGYVSTSNSGTQVLFDGVAAPIIYTQAAQASVVVPYEVSGQTSTQVQVVYLGQTSNTITMPVSVAVPGIFTSDSSGKGQGSIFNQDGTANSPGNPASIGSYVSLYATGEGQTNPPGIDGKPAGQSAPVPVAQPVTATIGGVPAVVQYAGGSPGSVAGLFQVNVQIPQGVGASSAVPIVISVGGQSSQANVSLAIK